MNNLSKKYTVFAFLFLTTKSFGLPSISFDFKFSPEPNIIDVTLYKDIPRKVMTNIGVNYAFAPVGRVITKDRITITDENGIAKTGNSNGTAFLVSPCHALTNRHVVFGNADPTLPRKWNLKFEIGNTSVGHTMHTIDAQAAIIPNDKSRANDWTLLLLKECIDDKKIGWMELTAEVNKYQKVIIAGFPYDIPKVLPTVSVNCEPKDFNVGFFYHSCPSVEGNSGAPLFFINDDGVPTALGMDFGSVSDTPEEVPTYRRPYANLAVSFDQIIPAIRRELQRGYEWFRTEAGGAENPQLSMAKILRSGRIP